MHEFEVEIIQHFVHEYLESDGLFILRVLSSNTSDFVCTELIQELWKYYRKQRKFNRSDEEDEDVYGEESVENSNSEAEAGGTRAPEEDEEADEDEDSLEPAAGQQHRKRAPTFKSSEKARQNVLKNSSNDLPLYDLPLKKGSAGRMSLPKKVTSSHGEAV